MEVKAGLLIVAEICKHTSVDVDEIGPISVVHAGIQDHQARRIRTADRAETALIPRFGNKFAQNIIRCIPLHAPFVHSINYEVSGRQRGEWEYLDTKADFRTN